MSRSRRVSSVPTSRRWLLHPHHVNEDYVLKIPEGIPLERAAPLLCAGITNYSPLSVSA